MPLLNTLTTLAVVFASLTSTHAKINFNCDAASQQRCRQARVAAAFEKCGRTWENALDIGSVDINVAVKFQPQQGGVLASCGPTEQLTVIDTRAQQRSRMPHALVKIVSAKEPGRLANVPAGIATSNAASIDMTFNSNQDFDVLGQGNTRFDHVCAHEMMHGWGFGVSGIQGDGTSVNCIGGSPSLMLRRMVIQTGQTTIQTAVQACANPFPVGLTNILNACTLFVPGLRMNFLVPLGSFGFATLGLENDLADFRGGSSCGHLQRKRNRRKRGVDDADVLGEFAIVNGVELVEENGGILLDDEMAMGCFSIGYALTERMAQIVTQKLKATAAFSGLAQGDPNFDAELQGIFFQHLLA